MRPFSDSIYLRHRAKKMRTLAYVATDPDEKRTARELAEDFEELARLADVAEHPGWHCHGNWGKTQ
jgi:hypothetical protein